MSCDEVLSDIYRYGGQQIRLNISTPILTLLYLSYNINELTKKTKMKSAPTSIKTSSDITYLNIISKNTLHTTTHNGV